MGRIIKAPNVQNERNYNIVERDKVLRHAEDEAAELIEAVTQEANRIREEAEAEAEALRNAAQEEMEAHKAELEAENAAAREEAVAQGRQAGYDQGIQDAKKEAAECMQTFRSLMAEGQSMLEGMFRDQEPEIREIISIALSRILKEKIEADDEVVARVAMECIGQAAERKAIRILVNEEDKGTIEKWVPEFIQRFDDLDKVDVAVDSRVGRGGVIVESSSGGIDGRVDKQLEQLQETIENG